MGIVCDNFDTNSGFKTFIYLIKGQTGSGNSATPCSSTAEPLMTVLSAKSVLSSGFRFHNGQMVPTVSGGSSQTGGSSEGSPGGSNSKTYIFEGILSAQSRGSGSGSSRRGSGMSQLTGGSNNSHVWETGQFWEDIFCGEWKIIMAEFSGQTVTIGGQTMTIGY